MSNLEHIRTHIEASAPCSLFSVAEWADNQLDVDNMGFVAIIDFLTAIRAVHITFEDGNFVVDII